MMFGLTTKLGMSTITLETDKMIDHLWLFQPIKWVLIGLLIYWVLSSTINND
jgi:hypothetical protein